MCHSSKLPLLLDVLPSTPSLRAVVVYGDAPTAAHRASASAVGCSVTAFADLEKEGAASPLPPVPPRPDDLATVCYTSGTTGNPKGAMLAHRTFVSTLAGVSSQGFSLTQDDVHCSYLPLAHCFERVVQAGLWHFGARVGFFRGDVTLLLEDLGALRPTVFPSVPRLFNRVYDKVLAGVRAAGGLKQALFERAMASKLYHLKHGGHFQHRLWDRLVFGKVQAVLGGRVRMMVTGAAPISDEVKNFLRVAFGCPVLEGYGLTETCAGATLTPPGAVSDGNVGLPIGCCELKLVDVAEMGYTCQDKPRPRGEVRGGRDARAHAPAHPHTRSPDLHARPQRVLRLLQAAGEDGGGDRRRRLVPQRRHWAGERGRQHQHH